MKSNEAQLVNLIRRQNRAAYEYLCQQCGSALFNILLKSVRNEETAKKLLQDVFIKIWKNIGSFPERGRLYNWMLNEARKMGVDYLRSKQLGNEYQYQTN